VAISLMNRAIKKLFLDHFPDPDKLSRGEEKDPYGTIRAWFSGGNSVDLLNDSSDQEFRKVLDGIAGLRKLVENTLNVKGDEAYTFMELALHGLAEFNVVNKEILESSFSFRDLLAGMLDDEGLFDDDDDDY
jgi:magnesium chelatase subunit I